MNLQSQLHSASMLAVIQQKQGRFPNLNYHTAWLGFEELGFETVLTETSDIPKVEAGAECIVVGEIPVMLDTFRRTGVRYQPLSYIPPELAPFTARRTWTSTLGEVRTLVASGQPVFAKPLEGTPRFFKGQVLRAFRDLIKTAAFLAEAPMWCAELVEFVSEHRVFVHEGNAVGIQFYSGDFRRTVDWAVVDAALQAHEHKPAGFALDFGVTSDGRTLVVEQNDGYSLGAYGLHPVAYARLLLSRWLEIMQDPKPRTVIIDWSRLTSLEEFYERVFAQTGAPAWHGRNLDALTDSWVTGGTCETGPPFRFVIRGSEVIAAELQSFAPAVREIARESVEQWGGTLLIE